MAAGQQHYQAHTTVKDDQFRVSFLLYCVSYHLMSAITSVSSFSHCSYSLRPSANLPLAVHFFPAPAYLSLSLLHAPACPFSLLLLPWLLLPSRHVAIASSSSLVMAHAFLQILMQNKSAVFRGRKKVFRSVCLDIARTECKMCSSYTRLETYCVSCFV